MKTMNTNNILLSIADYLNDFDYLVYGSHAYNFYTNLSEVENDIDIIISKTDFQEVVAKFTEDKNWKPFVFEKAVHINSASLKNPEGEPFDISLDSYEDYFEKFGINLKEFETKIIDGKVIKLIKLEDLIKIYEYASQTDHEKAEKYKIKLKNLYSLSK